MRKALHGIVLLAALAGCTGSLFKSDSPEPRTYALRPAPAPVQGVERLPASIRIGRPRAAPGLDSNQIAVLKDERELDHIRAAQWGDRAPRVLQAFLVASLDASGLFASVTPDDSPVPANYLIDIELRDFEVVYADAGPPVAKVLLVASLLATSERTLVDSFELGAEVHATENRLGPIVAAMEQASREVASELARRTAAAVAEQGPT